MSRGPEANFWNTIRKNLPKGSQAWRLENRVAAGMPDCYIMIDGYPLWIELKVTKSNSVKLSPQQIAWHMAHSYAGGHSLILVKRSTTGRLFLFEGREARDVASQGLLSEAIFSGIRVQEAIDAAIGSGRDHFGALFGSGSGRVRGPTHPPTLKK
jgi:Holliday junction resolvase